jgi:AsmA protein
LPEGQSLQRLSVAGTAHWNGTTLSFDDGSFALDGNSAVGVLAVTPGARPRVDATLAFERLALAPYVEGNAPSEPAAEQNDGLDQALLKYFDADLRISAAEITAPAIRLGRGGFTISAKAGRLASEVGELEICGGTAAGRIGLDLSNDVAKATLAVNVYDVPLDSCLKPLAFDLPISGLGDFKAALSTEGRNYDDLVKGLEGTFKVNAQNGAVPVDLNRLLASTSPLEGEGWSRSSVTLFDELNADCRLAAGHISCEMFNMQTRRGMISGSGEVDLGERKLDWSLFVANHARPLSTSQLSAETPPRISISGSLSQPMMRRADRPTFGEGSVPTNPANQVSPR